MPIFNPFKRFFKKKENPNDYVVVGKQLHGLIPEVFGPGGELRTTKVDTQNLRFRFKKLGEFSTARHKYVIEQNLTFEQYSKYLELSNYLEFGRTEVHEKAVGLLHYITGRRASEAWKTSDVMNIAITMGEICERTGPDWYAQHQDVLFKICSLFIRRIDEDRKVWSEDFAVQKIEDWKTGIIQPAVGDDFLFFFGLYETTKPIFKGSSGSSALTSYMRTEGSPNGTAT